MDAMCSARARALVQDLTSGDVENEEKYGKIGEKYGCLWQIHDITPLLVPSVLTKAIFR